MKNKMAIIYFSVTLFALMSFIIIKKDTKTGCSHVCNKQCLQQMNNEEMLHPVANLLLNF
jgi:hypothetical protein